MPVWTQLSASCPAVWTKHKAQCVSRSVWAGQVLCVQDCLSTAECCVASAVWVVAVNDGIINRFKKSGTTYLVCQFAILGIERLVANLTGKGLVQLSQKYLNSYALRVHFDTFFRTIIPFLSKALFSEKAMFSC